MFRSGRLRWRQGKRVWGYIVKAATSLSPSSGPSDLKYAGRDNLADVYDFELR